MNEEARVFANRRKVTHIIPSEGAFVWVRTFAGNAGYRGGRTLEDAPPGRLTASGVCFNFGEPFRNGTAYRVESDLPIVQFFNRPNALTFQDLNEIVSHLGEALAQLHLHLRTGANPSSCSSMDTMRFISGITEHIEPDKATQIYDSLHSRLPARLIADLLDWYQTTPGFLGHGEYSLANMVTSSGSSEIQALVDPILPYVPAGFDVGWFLADLFEIAMSPIGGFGPRPATKLGVTFLNSYLAFSEEAVSREPFEGIRNGFLVRLIHHYIEFRAGGFSAGEEQYFLDAITREYEAGSGTFVSTVLAGAGQENASG